MYTFDNDTTFSGDGDYNFMEVFDYNSPADLLNMQNSIIEGLDLFEDIFGYKSKSFIAPCYKWDSHIERTLVEKGVKYLQGLVVQSVPTGMYGKYERKFHFMGKRNKYGQLYLMRNCFFEPSLSEDNEDPVGECLKRIKLAFKWGKPAIICSHRINYMGSLDENNRAKNLDLLKDLLNRSMREWPDLEFMTTDQLGDIMVDKQQ
jgi:hypothetical protein